MPDVAWVWACRENGRASINPDTVVGRAPVFNGAALRDAARASRTDGYREAGARLPGWHAVSRDGCCMPESPGRKHRGAPRPDVQRSALQLKSPGLQPTSLSCTTTHTTTRAAPSVAASPLCLPCSSALPPGGRKSAHTQPQKGRWHDR
eukprot:359139-Chlamydomonas_euryale.AAC.1